MYIIVLNIKEIRREVQFMSSLSFHFKGWLVQWFAEILLNYIVHRIPLYIPLAHILKSKLPAHYPIALTPYNCNQLLQKYHILIVLVSFFDDSPSHWSLSSSMVCMQLKRIRLPFTCKYLILHLFIGRILHGDDGIC